MALRQHFSEMINSYKHDVLTMGALVEEAIRAATTALVQKDVELARRTIAADEAINRLELRIQDECINAIATEQPVASDLRTIMTIIKIVPQLERMGDHAAHIAKAAVQLAEEKYIKRLIDIPRMSEIVIGMVHGVLAAFIEHDAGKAEEIAKRDDEVDNLYDQVIRELITYMMQDPTCVKQAISLLFVARYLERLGDHVTNIGEWIYYDSTGMHRELNP